MIAKKICSILILLAFHSIAFAQPPSQPARYATANCTSMRSVNLPNLQIASAKLIEADRNSGLPEHCHVFGFINVTIGFEARFPSSWNGNMYFGGTGGFAGYFADTTAALRTGYATISTDTGHQADILDASWALENRSAEINYGYLAVHKTAVAGKALIKSYYGRGRRLSCIEVCSNRGRQGMM